jgi:hypothetical protein
LFEEDDPGAPGFGGGDGGQEAGRSGADDSEVEHGFGHGKTLYRVVRGGTIADFGPPSPAQAGYGG